MSFEDDDTFEKFSSQHRSWSPHQTGPPEGAHCQGHLRSRRRQISISESDEDDVFGEESHVFRVRSFRTSARGFENRGDSFRKRSRNSIKSTGSSSAEETQSLRRLDSDVSNASDDSECSVFTLVSDWCPETRKFCRIVFLGASGVGKTSLLRQCLTSDFRNSFEYTNQEDEEEDHTMCVLLDGEEYMVELLDGLTLVECQRLRVDAYIVVFSVSCEASFSVATGIIQKLRVERSCTNPIILVANKVDLVRQRKVKEEDMWSKAKRFGCKCVETSTAINHNVDDLVVGMLTQIRLKEADGLKSLKSTSKSSFRRKRSIKKKIKALSFLGKLFKNAKKRNRSCENLLQL